MSKITRGQKGEQSVIDALNEIKEHHYLLNNLTFVNKKSEMSHQIDHILIHPNGIFIIETKNYFGKITYEPLTKEWFKTVKGKKIRISSPISQNKSHAITLYRALKGQYELIPVVVYVKNNAPYLPDESVINLKDLLLYIESFYYANKKIAKYSDSQMLKIKKEILSQVSQVSNDEHVQNIQILKQIKQENENEMAYAIETGTCPRCGAKMTSKNLMFNCTKCDYKFNL